MSEKRAIIIRTADDCVAKAHEMEALAATARTATDRAVYQKLAESWREISKRAATKL